MKNLIIACCFLMGTAVASNLPLQKQLDEFVEHNFADNSVALVVQDLHAGETLYTKSADKLFRPASLQKLFTAAASMQVLGPEYRFTTILWGDLSRKKKNTMHGSLGLEFSGDPSLTKQHLEKFIITIKQQGIHEIKGDIIIDDSLFVGPDVALGWMHSDTAWYYGAPSTAIVINQNAVRATINASKSLGEQVAVTLSQPEEAVALSSDLITVTQQQSEDECQLETYTNADNSIQVKGCWPVQSEKFLVKFAIKNPRQALSLVLTQYLTKHKISLQGRIVFGKKPQSMQQLVVHHSVPLSQLITVMLQDSNNLYAENIAKIMAANLYHKGSFKMAVKAIKTQLGKYAGINFTKARLEDASGLSEYNLLTPRQVMRLLQFMYFDEALAKHFVEGLALSGNSGTLTNRLRGFDTNAKIKAKTGSASGVSGLAGYMITGKERQVAIVFMANNFIKQSEIKALEDELCQLIVRAL